VTNVERSKLKVILGINCRGEPLFGEV